MAVRTKRKLELENTALKGSSPPDSDELAKNMKKSGLNPEDAGLEQPTDKKKDSATPEQPEEPVTPPEQPEEPERITRNERTVEEFEAALKGPPTLQQTLQISMMRFGFREGQSRQVVEYAAEIGGPNVFTDPAKLLNIMNEFSNIGNPALRKVAIDFYLKKANIQSTAEYEEKAGLLPDRAKNLDNLKKEADRIYGFNESNGTIRQAQDGEKALTRQQAEAMKADWLADHPKATNDPKDEAPKYIKNENTGMWMINPDAKNLTPGDYAYLDNTLNPKPDSLDLIAMGEAKKNQMQETLGIKPNGNGTDKEMLTLILENNKLQMTQVMTQMSSTMTDAIKGMTAVVEKLTVKTEDPAVAELKEANKALLKRLDDERELRHQTELERRDKELAATNKKIEDLANRPPAGSDTELGVIKDLGGKALDKLDKGIGELVGLAKTNLPPLGRTEKANLQAGLKEAAGTKPVVSGEVPADVKEGLSKYR